MPKLHAPLILCFKSLEPRVHDISITVWRRSLWDIMEFFPATLLTITVSNIDRHYEVFAKAKVGGEWSAGKVIAQKDRTEFDAVYEQIEKFCGALELVAATATLRKMRECLKRPGSTYKDFFSLGPEFSGRFKDEMEGRLVFALNAKDSELAKDPRKGWEEIVARFPQAGMDIEEARWCMALERYTASVFHSLQIVEFGLVALGQSIGVADPKSGWTATTKALKRIIDAKYQDRTEFQRRQFDFFEQVHGTVEGLKNAWRNKVSHAQGRLTLFTSDFTPAIAEEILLATRAFMRRLALDAPHIPASDSI